MDESQVDLVISDPDPLDPTIAVPNFIGLFLMALGISALVFLAYAVFLFLTAGKDKKKKKKAISLITSAVLVLIIYVAGRIILGMFF